MQKEFDVAVTPEVANTPELLNQFLSKETGIPLPQLRYRIHKRSIDARKKQVLYRLRIQIFDKEPPFLSQEVNLKPQNVTNRQEVHIIGAGPAGLFAAVELIKNGLKPVIIERGKDVRARRRDLAAINKEQTVNPESNYCFGEGGAGTYSDGKLYTRSRKRGSVLEVLQEFVAFGATEDILIDAHPHIGTNKLPELITKMREYILECGGEVHFNTKLTNIGTEAGKINFLELNDSEKVDCRHVILATGHSARDIFLLLNKNGISIEAKPFALGVRVEHPQEIIDSIQYKCDSRGEFLPPASYSLVQQVGNKGVYSFCMCPGGIIAPCATAPGEVVTNGWSPSKRNNPYANSGMVVSIEAKDYDPQNSGNPLKALQFQQQVEKAAFVAGGGGQVAPAQRLVDFTRNKPSQDLPRCSYQPGLNSVDLKSVLPGFVHDSLREAFKHFDKKMRGYFTNEAVLVATESRTSSPVRIPRDPDTLQHPQISGLYPCGEGAGYAGGIVSAALDGKKCAQAIARVLSPSK